MEYRDLYDSNRKFTGKKIKKDCEIPNGYYYVTVLVFIENNNHEFLLQVNKKYNMWSTTGGHPKSGKSSLEGIATEIKEELGYAVNPKGLKLIKTYKTDDDFVDVFYLKEDIPLDLLTLQEEEVGNIKYFNRSEIDKLISNNMFLPSHIKYYYDCIKYIDYTSIN